jgi:hypothetical protein
VRFEEVGSDGRLSREAQGRAEREAAPGEVGLDGIEVKGELKGELNGVASPLATTLN